jgi:hypothetical protein
MRPKLDQAGWHVAGELLVPSNMRLTFLPPYSPELDPAEHLWKALREDCFAKPRLQRPHRRRARAQQWHSRHGSQPSSNPINDRV